MLYKSTRNSKKEVSAAKAIVKGISDDGGLFVPCSLPKISLDDLNILKDKNYIERAVFILSKFLTDFTEQEIIDCVKDAYSNNKFSSKDIAKVLKLDEQIYMLELWHGPTCAFKDMALQLLPHLMKVSMKKQADGKQIAILVATSGDTGKAALEGFKNVEGTNIIVFYPQDGVSLMQKLQMVTQLGDNVDVCAIKGNFDDAQNGVKAIFTDSVIIDELFKNNVLFSSANSINWGRLVPQIVYYFSAYCDILKKFDITLGEEVNVVVPTGNFGNILSAYYGKKMGLPIKTFICASNKNNILTDFINTGIYDKNRSFYQTISPSMDILISSNLERLLYDIYDSDEAIKKLYSDLAKYGKFTIDDNVKFKIKSQFYGGFCDDGQTKKTICHIFKKYKYLCDTHTAVAVSVYNDYKKETGDETKTIIASTASPYKFTKDVLSSIGGKTDCDDFAQLDELSKMTDTTAPKQLLNLKDAKIRFKNAIDKDDMKNYVLQKFTSK